MFTGIIEEIGKIKDIRSKGNIGVLSIYTDKIYKDVNIGDSVSVNGVCLTSTQKNKNILTFEVTDQTLKRTNLRYSKINDSVNLEKSMKADGNFSGHFVYGHIDGTRPIINLKNNRNASYIDIGIEREDHNFIVEKGSITIDGISLTIGEIFKDKIRIFLIPYTLKNTTIFNKKIMDFVNIEFDILGKYASKTHRDSRITEEFLKKSGF